MNERVIDFQRRRHEDPHPVQIEAWRRMTPDEKYRLVMSATRLMMDCARQRIIHEHPDWTPDQVQHELSRTLIRART